VPYWLIQNSWGAGAQFTCFTSTQVQMLTPQVGADSGDKYRSTNTDASTEVRILTRKVGADSGDKYRSTNTDASTEVRILTRKVGADSGDKGLWKIRRGSNEADIETYGLTVVVPEVPAYCPNLACKNSALTLKDCTCKCSGGWSGASCESCALSCKVRIRQHTYSIRQDLSGLELAASPVPSPARYAYVSIRQHTYSIRTAYVQVQWRLVWS
jgi:hypothetical protein